MENRELQRLDSFLATLDPEEPVAIGAGDGSGWLCFTRARDLGGIQAAFDAYRQGKQIKLRDRWEQLYRLVTYPPALTGDPEKDWKRVWGRAKTISKLRPMIKTVQRYLDGYTPPLERFVVDTYCKEVDGPRLGIVIEGTEIGYWTESEAEEG